MSDIKPPPPQAPGEDEEKYLRDQLGECYISQSWMFSVAGVLIAIPLCVKLRSYNPLVYSALGGTLADLLAGMCVVMIFFPICRRRFLSFSLSRTRTRINHVPHTIRIY